MARAGRPTPPGHGRCSFATTRGLPARHTLGPGRGAMQGFERCPNHPHGGCSLARHGTYTRKSPRGTKVARWYCPESHTTFSLLPDCLAARLPGELDEVERVVAHAEQAASRVAAADALRHDAVELPGAMRWVARRVRLVHHVLGIVIGLLPEHLMRCVAEVGAVRTRLGTETGLLGASHPARRAAPRAARTVGVPTPPSRGDEPPSRPPTQDGA